MNTQPKVKRDCHFALENGLTILYDNDLFDEMLDDCYENVMIAGLEYTTSQALKAVDPTAYRCGKADYIASRDDLIELDDGTLVYTDELEALNE
jgi:hypothetical protein